ncbi:hypothetical protein HJC23_005059 [Cyclotella cryptica]|uniref:Uncharacterized protein n=1 Tax=Cyclotella cryptica TaxID=29204 RepID=A0ABD3QF94_9STRA|eukprot:CCRYP_006279-RA/>CCRYP_006279-RA protein AED:0.04 eAED:0.04 QI:327/1/1/1/1/1/2/243/154
MDYSDMRTATLRSVFASAYVANIVVAILFMANHGFVYLNTVATILVIILSTVMLSITLQRPERLMVYFEVSGHTIVFTFLTRTICDLTLCVLLLGMGFPGQIMCIVTLAFLGAARGLAKRRPDIFRELFRAHASDPDFDAGEDSGARYEEAGDK